MLSSPATAGEAYYVLCGRTDVDTLTAQETAPFFRFRGIGFERRNLFSTERVRGLVSEP